MHTRTILAGISVALVAVPFVTSAATISDLQAEIAGLLAQIQALQTQGSASASATVSANGTGSLSGTVVSSSCPNFIRSLSIGSRGSDVTTLQQFLSDNGFLNVSATGYFGALTRTALARWQASAGIAASGSAGSGIFGPLSRTYFKGHCGSGGGTTTAQPFSADPSSGNVPLNVSFTTSDSVTSSSTYSVDFGDGSSSAMTKGECVGITAIVGGQGGIRCSFSVSHTYTSNGTYAAKLLKQTHFNCPDGLMCAQSQAMILPAPQVVATQTITVGSSTSNSVNFSASPTSGVAPLSVQFTETVPQGMTLATAINFGDGSNGTLGVVPVCSSCNAEAATTHTYTSPGTYTATLTSGMCSCPANGICNCPNMMIVGTATVTVTGTSTATSSIQQLNAPGTVTLAQNGIAEIRNESFYFTLNSLTASTATIQLTPVGCWNSFPSDTPPPIRCMIAVVPIPPQTLSIGRSYAAANYGIELTGIANNEATFSITASSSNSY